MFAVKSDQIGGLERSADFAVVSPYDKIRRER